MASYRCGPWSSAEDESLMQLVQIYGPLNWVKIAQTHGSRNRKQCRDRYHHYLKPTLNHDPITPDEGARIDYLVESGKSWAEIARLLHGRSENAVKNWWNNKRRRLNRRRTTHTIGPPDQVYPRSMPVSGRSLPLPQPNSIQSAIDQHSQWTDGPLPSPCSSEPPDTKPCAHDTISPRRIPGLHRRALELAPLQASPGSKAGEAGLSSLGSLARPVSIESERLHYPQHRTQLPTAPNSPVPHQLGHSTTGRDSRMDLSSLLA